MDVFEKSKWIWMNDKESVDVYAEFFDTFDYSNGNVSLYLSADSNYAVSINGRFVNSGQYPDFPHYKVYDKLDITEYCVSGENKVAITVWHYGETSLCYYMGNPALIYSVVNNEKIVCASDESTLSRKSRTYENGRRKLITGQLGFGFHYDITREDKWQDGVLNGFEKSVTVNQHLELYPRPINKVKICDLAPVSVVKSDNFTHYLLDLGAEEVGYLSFKLKSSCKQKLLISYGEHINDGCVRRIIGSRDFSVEVTVGEGENEYFNPFRRLGLRYLEVFCENPIEIEYFSIRPTVYEIDVVGKKPEDALRAKIYDTSVRTLQMCMHDHYEDCPWREQALYAMDSRNQMLFGYYAFGDYAFQRASLYLFSKDNRADGQLAMCAPSSEDLVIPSFSLHYITEVYEYTMYSKDVTLIREIYPKLESIIASFDKNEEDGLISNFASLDSKVFSGRRYWNFYEWADGLDGRDKTEFEGKQFDLSLNALYVLALGYMSKLAKLIGLERDYDTKADKMRQEIFARFYDAEGGVFKNGNVNSRISELANSLAILCGAAKGEIATSIAEKLRHGNAGLTPTTLSMLCFKYDALLAVDKDKYKDYIIDEIDTKFKRMLDAGATTFWETELGDRDFRDAGSLCHGWSALPIYYYTILEA